MTQVVHRTYAAPGPEFINTEFYFKRTHID